MGSQSPWKRHGKHEPSGFFISCKGLCALFVWLNPEFQFRATTIMSTASKSSDSKDWTWGANLQMEGHIPKPSGGQKDPEEKVALGSTPSHLPSWSLTRKLLPGHPNTRHCLGIHMTLTEETGAAHPPPHVWMAPLVEDMLHYGRTCLTEAVVMGPGRAILFYGRWLMGEGLSLGEARDATFTFTGAGTWVGKPAYLATNPLPIQEAQWIITQAVTECWIEVRGLGWPCSHPLTQQPFRFYHPGDSPWKDCPGDSSFNHQTSPCRLQRDQDHDWCRGDQGLIPPWPLSPSSDHGFESNRSSLSTASLVSSLSDRSKGSQHSQCGRWCRETRAHMKINLPIFKDEDAKDAITYQSWRWDLTVYHCAGCRDCTLLPYAIQPLLGYPRELVQSLGMDITLDKVLTILDEHYNNVQALDALNQELFQLWMADKEIVLDWGIYLLRHLQVLAASFPECFPPDHVAKLKHDCITVGYPNILKPWLPTLRPTHRKKVILITCRLQEKQRRKTPWSYPKAHEAWQLITLPNQGWPLSSPCRSSGGPSQPLKHLRCPWRRRVPRGIKK